MEGGSGTVSITEVQHERRRSVPSSAQKFDTRTMHCTPTGRRASSA